MVLRTVVCSLGTGGGALVTRIARDTHDCGCCSRAKRVSLESDFLRVVVMARFNPRDSNVGGKILTMRG